MVGLLWTVAVILFVLWLLGFLVFHITSGLIHIVLVIAIIVVVWNLIMGSRSRRTL